MMRKYFSRLFRTTLLSTAFLISACMLFQTEENSAHDGGGSDTETLTGLVLSPTGNPSARTTVKLIPSNYDPSKPDTTRIRRSLTDDSGHFHFDKLTKTQVYNVIAGMEAEKIWTFATGLKAGQPSKNLTLTHAKVFFFSMHSDDYSVADSGIAFFPGTDILTRCNGITASQLDSVPEGALRFIVASRAGWQHDTTLVSVVDTTKVSASLSLIKLLP